MSRLMKKTDRHGRRIPALPTQDIEFRSFFETVPREQLVLACQASEKERLQLFAQVLEDKNGDFKRYTLVTRASKMGVTLKNLLDAFTDFQKSEALATMAARMPRVAADIAQEAETRRMECPKCRGVGKVTIEDEELTCESCWGTGEKRESGDPRARDQMLEALEITGKKVPLVAQQFNMDGGFSVDALIKQGQKALEGR